MERETAQEKVSVLMGVYNCEEYVGEAIESIQNQTYSNWELIICDDGSQDHTIGVVRKYSAKDKRIRLLKNKKNLGLNYSLNKCLKYATGKYIARQDGDDFSLPKRFERQIRALEENPEYEIVSSPMIFFDNNGDWGRNYVKEYPDVKDIVCGSPICHAPVMMFKECMDKVGGYTVDPRVLRVEDVNLWIKLYDAGYKCHNLADPLYKMRNDKNAFVRRKYRYRINSTYVRLKGCRIFHLSPTCYLKAFCPMIYGLAPAWLRVVLRRYKNHK